MKPFKYLLQLLLILLSYTAHAQCDLGKNYAVFFAVEDYSAESRYKDLKYPVKEMLDLAKILHETYAFDTTLLVNPTKKDIEDRLKYLSENINWGPNDQLLLYFSGHGGKEATNEGYFIPKNGKLNQLGATCVQFDYDFVSKIDGIPCNHQLVIMDACNSGTLLNIRGRGTGRSTVPQKLNINEFQENLEILCRHQARISRLAMAAAATNEEAPPKSKVADGLTKILKDYSSRNKILYAQTIYSQLLRVEPPPEFGHFHQNNYPGASFLFISKSLRQLFEKEGPCELDRDICKIPADNCMNCPQDRNEQSYPIDQVSKLIWLNKNLNYPLSNNSLNPDCEDCGILYTWKEAIQACKTIGPGWRLPTAQEWQALTLEIGTGYDVSEFGVQGKGAYKRSFDRVMTQINRWKPQFAGYAYTNAKGKKRFVDTGDAGWYWTATSSEVNTFNALAFQFSQKAGRIIQHSNKLKKFAMACRCVRD